MKQPELGKKLTALRKARGLTQEELVERCNISVRTIQRIENGDVAPRSYTVRTILSVLGYDFNEIFNEEALHSEAPSAEKPFADSWGQATSADVSRNHHTISTRQLSIALLSGFVYYLLTFPEAMVEYSRFTEGTIIFGNAGYTLLKIILLGSFIVFQLGFIRVGKLFDDYLIRIAAIIHIAILAGLYVADVVSIGSPDDNKFMIVPAAILYGVIGVLYGIALIRLRENLGTTALLAGGLEILSGCFFFTVALFPLADLLSMLAEFLELVILYKVIDLVRNRSGNV